MPPKSTDKSESQWAKRRSSRKGMKPTFTEQERRKQILQVATDIFGSEGYEGTSLDDIAKSAGVSRGVIFYYFEGKREIGAQVLRECLQHYSSYVQERVAKKLSATDQLLEFIAACLDYLNAHRDDYLLYVDLVGCFGTTHDKYEVSITANRNTRKWLSQIIRRGQKEGDIGKVPVANLADVIQGVIDGLMELHALEPDTVSIPGCKELLRQMIKATIRL